MSQSIENLVIANLMQQVKVQKQIIDLSDLLIANLEKSLKNRNELIRNLKARAQAQATIKRRRIVVDSDDEGATEPKKANPLALRRKRPVRKCTMKRQSRQ